MYRLSYIDAVRGIAACSVMIQHALYASGLLNIVSDPSLETFIPKYLELGETGVVAFFLVSGFVIPLSLDKVPNLLTFWIHRLLRIYPLYIFVYFSTFIISQGNLQLNFLNSLINFVTHLLLIQEYVHARGFVGGAWTLSLEMIWYVAISGLYFSTIYQKSITLVIASVSVSIAACIICAFGLHLPMGRLSMLVCCIIGCVCYRLQQGRLNKYNFLIFLAILLSAIECNLLVGFLLFPSSHPTATFIMVQNSWALGFIIFFIPFLSQSASIWRQTLFLYLGRISYSVYLIHGVVLIVFGLMDLKGLWLIVLTCTSTILLSHLSYRYVEAPPIRFGRRLYIGKERRPKTA